LKCYVRILVYVLFFILGLTACFSQPNPGTPFVEIDGMKSSYRSCEPVEFSIRNVSENAFFAEIYVENLNSGSWTNDVFPYNLHNPASLYEKPVLTDSDKLAPGQSWVLSYKRCARPRFVKQSTTTFRRSIEEKDNKASHPLSQRIRVEIYRVREGRIELMKKEWSRPFSRFVSKR